MKLKIKNIGNKWFIIRLVVFSIYIVWLLAYIQWGMDYVYLGLVEQPKAEHQQLVFEIESARKELAEIPNLVVEREQQLLNAQELLASENNRLPGRLNINGIVGNIVDIADRCQVKAIPLTTTSSESKIISDYKYNYRAFKVFMSVEGKFQNMVEFVDYLDGKDIPNAATESISLRLDEENPDILNLQNDVAPVSGTLSFVVYTRAQDFKEESK